MDNGPKVWFQGGFTKPKQQSLLRLGMLKVLLVTLFLQDPGSNAIFLSAFCLEMLTALTSGTCCCDIRSLRRLNEIEAEIEDEKSPLV